MAEAKQPNQPTPIESTPSEPAPLAPAQSIDPMPPSQKIQPATKQQKKTMLIVVAGVLLVLGLGSLFAFAVMGSSREAKLATALGNFKDADSMTVDLNIEGGSEDVSAVGEGSASVNFPEHQASLQAELDLVFFKVGMEARHVDGDYYVKVDGLEQLEPLLGSFIEGFIEGFTGAAADDLSPEGVAQRQELQTQLTGAFGLAIDELNNKWIMLDGEIAENAGVNLAQLMDDFRANYDNVDNIEDLLTIKEVLEDEDIDGSSATHMVVNINTQEAQDALVKLLGGLAVGDTALSEDDVRNGVEDMLDGFNPSSQDVDVWVDNASNQLVQLQVEVSDSGSDVTVTLNFSDFNAVPVIEKPDDALVMADLERIFADLAKEFGIDDANLQDYLTTGL